MLYWVILYYVILDYTILYVRPKSENMSSESQWSWCPIIRCQLGHGWSPLDVRHQLAGSQTTKRSRFCKEMHPCKSELSPHRPNVTMGMVWKRNGDTKYDTNALST